MIFKILGVTSDYTLSKLIEWSTDEEVSHMAFVLTEDAEEKERGIVFQASTLGCKVLWQKDLWIDHKPVYELQVPVTTDKEKKDIYDFINDNNGKPYDYPKLFADGFYYIRYKLFGTKVPETTRILNAQAMLCDDLATQLPDWIFKKRPGRDNTKTPLQMLLAISAQHSEWKLVHFDENGKAINNG